MSQGSYEGACAPAAARPTPALVSKINHGAARAPLFFVFGLLLIEFLDELVDGVYGAAWPSIRDDLRLSYTEVGVLLSVPAVFGNVVEPLLGILGDVWKRRALVVCGGLGFALASLLVSASYSFAALLAALVLFSPSSGAFVSLSQATLMDAEPSRHEQNMARWTLFGSLGNAAGPLLLGASVWLGMGWRWPFALVAALTLLMVAAAARFPFPAPAREADSQTRARSDLRDGVRQALAALRRREVLRWLVMLELGDFTWDLLRGFLALYFVDVVGLSESKAAMAVVVYTFVGLPGDFLLIPLLERVRGLSYLRWSLVAVLVLYPSFLLAPGLTLKLALLALLGLAGTGGYAILMAQLYKAMPGRSGTVMTVHNVAGLFGGLVPLALGLAAERYGLEAMMWLLLIGPASVLVGLLSVREDNSNKDGQDRQDEEVMSDE